jgi:hypothetical protein
MKYLNCVVFLIFLSVIPVMTAVRGQSDARTESQTATARPRVEIHVKEEVQFILGAVLRGTALSGGVAEEVGCSTFPAAQLDVQQGATVQEAMGVFVAQNPAYRWSEDANVVNLAPVVEFPLLNAKIRSFELETTDTRAAEAVLYDLLNLPEIRQRAAELNLKPGLRQGGLAHLNPGSHQRTLTPIRLSLHDISLQEAFNSVVRVYGHTIWMYDERHCNGERTYVVRASKEY